MVVHTVNIDCRLRVVLCLAICPRRSGWKTQGELYPHLLCMHDMFMPCPSDPSRSPAHSLLLLYCS